MTTIIEREIRIPVTRVRESCAPCRKRKSRCDAAHPCSSCTLRGTEKACTYASASSSGPVVAERSATGTHSSQTTGSTSRARARRANGSALIRRRSSSPDTGARSVSASEMPSRPVYSSEHADRPGAGVGPPERAEDEHADLLRTTLDEVRRLAGTVLALETHVHALSAWLDSSTPSVAVSEATGLSAPDQAGTHGNPIPAVVDMGRQAPVQVQMQAPAGAHTLVSAEGRGSLLGAGPRPTAVEKDNWDVLRRALPSKEDCEVLLDFLIIECDYIINLPSPVPLFVAAFERGACSMLSLCLMAAQLALSSLLLHLSSHCLYPLSSSAGDVHNRLWSVVLSCAPNLAPFETYLQAQGAEAAMYVDFARCEDLYLGLSGQSAQGGEARMLDCVSKVFAAGWMNEDGEAWTGLDTSTARERRRSMVYNLIIPLRFRFLQFRGLHTNTTQAIAFNLVMRNSLSLAPTSPTSLPPFAGLTAPLSGVSDDRLPLDSGSYALRIFRLKSPEEMSDLLHHRWILFQLSGLAVEVQALTHYLLGLPPLSSFGALRPEMVQQADNCLISLNSRDARRYALDHTAPMYSPGSALWTDYAAVRQLGLKLQLRHGLLALKSTFLLALGTLDLADDPARTGSLEKERQKTVRTWTGEADILKLVTRSQHGTYCAPMAREAMGMGPAIVAQELLASRRRTRSHGGTISTAEGVRAFVGLLKEMETLEISVLTPLGRASMERLEMLLVSTQQKATLSPEAAPLPAPSPGPGPGPGKDPGAFNGMWGHSANGSTGPTFYNPQDNWGMGLDGTALEGVARASAQAVEAAAAGAERMVAVQDWRLGPVEEVLHLNEGEWRLLLGD